MQNLKEKPSENYIIKDRKAKLGKLKELGLDPYPAVTSRNTSCKSFLDNFEKLKGKEVIVAGRIRAKRGHGKISFIDIQDEGGNIQIIAMANNMGKNFDLVKLLDMGDFLEVSGKVILSKTNAKSIEASAFKILSKSIRPLPEKRKGLSDIEERYRRRYLDLLSHPEIAELFRKKSKFISSIREFLSSEGFLEVETPILEAIPGGADANPFKTKHDVLDMNFYLRISPELHLKRLIVGGYDKVFEIGRLFRNEGVSTQHLQEFTNMEFYWAYSEYEELMKFTEKFFEKILMQTFGTLDFSWKGKKFSFKSPIKRLDYVEAFKAETGIYLDKVKDAKELHELVKKLKLKDIDPKLNYGRLVDAVYKRTVRPKIVGPVFLINHPVEISPLAKKHRSMPGRVERMQMVLLGAEVVNSWSELNDPEEQRMRFEEQMKMRKEGDGEAQMMDEDYVRALEYGMPPTSGFGLGLDRIFTFLSGQESIRDVVFFPMVRKEE